MIENWKDIPDFPRYQISDHGRIWSDKTNRFIKCHTMQKGYWHVVLCHQNKPKTIRLNRLVLSVFRGNPPSDEHQAAHKDGNKDNNKLSNLYWATAVENAADRLRHGTYRSGFNHPMAKLTKGDLVFAKWRRSIGYKWADISKELGVSADVISRRVRRFELDL